MLVDYGSKNTLLALFREFHYLVILPHTRGIVLSSSRNIGPLGKLSEAKYALINSETLSVKVKVGIKPLYQKPEYW